MPKRPYRQVPAPAERHISVAVPAIVDEELFTSAAERLQENRKRNRERLAGVQYLLRGLLVCQTCGYGFTGHHHQGRWRYYRCCVAPIAAASTVRPVVMRGWLRSSRSMMPCGPRFVGCWKTPRS